MADFAIPRRTALKGLAAAGLGMWTLPAQSAAPIKIGFSESLTGGLAASGKASLLTKQIWVEQVNAKGGILGREVQLVYYDDQSSPAQAPPIFSKLLDIDAVNVLLGNGTNITSAVMPIVMQRNRMILSHLSLAVNDQFKYPRYFQTMPFGPTGKEEISRGFFEAAKTISPPVKTVAIAGADAEFALNAMEGARAHAKRMGLKIVYDRSYPPNMVEFSSVIRAIAATNPDIVFVAGYPPDSAGMLRAALETKLKTKMFGGGMVGMQYASIKQQFGEGLNGVVNYETFVPEPTMKFDGITEFLTEYRKRAPAAQVDPLGHYVPPIIYATMQVLEQAIAATGGTDDAKLSDYMHKAKFPTIIGDIQFNADGEWTKGRILMTQFRDIKGNGFEQFFQAGKQVILYPPELKSGDLRPGFPPEAS
ncbi:MAG: amino acid ABC transporter substrate-binding protein [Rhizobiales bacterium]|nr:amino acid ABC transporter substrate-binding protein [Hyphomicrobiales bacterium]